MATRRDIFLFEEALCTCASGRIVTVPSTVICDLIKPLELPFPPARKAIHLGGPDTNGAYPEDNVDNFAADFDATLIWHFQKVNAAKKVLSRPGAAGVYQKRRHRLGSKRETFQYFASEGFA